MNRRDFVKIGSLVSIASVSSFDAIAGLNDNSSPPAWLKPLIKKADEAVISLMTLQVSDPSDKNYGGIKDGTDILNPHSTAALMQYGACSIFGNASGEYDTSKVLPAMAAAASYLTKIQHSDGTIDLLSTNFHSTPDTGFIVKRLANAYELLGKSKVANVEIVLTPLKQFLLKGGEALIAGGIHTPNHRWVVSAALARLYALWPDERYKKRAEQWLSEHIDVDSDGQYNEKSTLIYSPLTDRLLITIARDFKKPELLAIVRKNLSMTEYYVHPNAEVVTDASGRQDKALVGTMEGYYFSYRYLAIMDKSAEYSGMCKLIETTAFDKLAGYLDYLLNSPELWKELPVASNPPVNYVKSFPNSGLVRIRRNNWDSTIIAMNPVWCTFMNGNAVLQGIRIASSFFGKGQFMTEKIEKKGNQWILTQKLEGPYYQPIAKELIVPDGDWNKMLREKRPQSEVQILTAQIIIEERPKGLNISISMEGTEGVPVALEFIFRSGGQFSGLTKVGTNDNQLLLPSGMGRYSFGKDSILFGPGQALHKNIALRGALPPIDAPTVFVTGFTPFRQSVDVLAE